MTAKLWPKSSPTRSPPSSPFLGNYNGNVGPGREGSQWFVNIQPVVPITLDADWHVISRTILPVMLNQNDLFPGAGSQSGLRDTTQGLYFSPSRTFNGFTWGVGPIFLLPTATDKLHGRQDCQAWAAAGQHRWRRALLGRLSRHRSPWFRRSARDDLPVSGAMIEVAGDVDSEVKQQTATNQRKEQIMSDTPKQENWTKPAAMAIPK